jgi:rfaE bifunctional protein nucleotidyltransferase chain/domain
MKNKIVSRQDAKIQIEIFQKEGKTVGYTSGVFDLLHPGHVQYLEDAKAKVDILVVGINSDSSVKKNKGALRPIINQQARAEVVAGLVSTDLVFIFDETNNNINITELKPNIYLKAGDYSLDKLSSKPIIESYGGTVELVPVKAGFSTSNIIENICLSYGLNHAEPDELSHEPSPALFVDRDGTMIEHVEYLHEPEKLKPIPGALEALKKARDAGYRIIVVTNQPGIGLGYFTKEDLFATNKALMKEASKVGLMIDKIYYSPYSKADNTKCRKPNPGMVLRAAKEMNIILSESYCIGDMTSDVQLAKNSGCKAGVLVKTGVGGKDGICNVVPDFTLDSLAELGTIIK